uniref:sodium- and chloride-dependent glycine transporter 2-like n=1 Tax=Styela clava TaxID=7725 RepID=UPI00193AA695|nr:sodium- and chloride-dependent glycine transporter 2-like [Styela clava]XP_039264487.1 sodium- and chloride-dependent glycine transporter 2-like [Styela clava]XP_039264495.1 sodium- and chloride-dependent glycine transporter 2-like [Styela clava]
MAPSYMSQSEPERKTWPNKLEYHLTLFCQALGLCSFWRFPYLAYENGGAPFVYAYLFLYIIVGIPLVFLEMAWGQYSNLAPPQGFSIIPIMQGVGWCMILMAILVVLYFGAATYYLLLYLLSSFANPLPFSTCDNSWNTLKCQTELGPDCVAAGTEGLEYRIGVGHGIASPDGSFNLVRLCNYTSDGTQTTPAIEFWQNNLASNAAVCHNLSEITNTLIGSSQVILLPSVGIGCCVLLRMIIGFISLFSDVRFTGKVSYVLCSVPFAVSVMLLVRCLTLEKASTGLQYLFVPSNITSFQEPKVWKDALSQVLMSLMVTWGGLSTWASYNRFYNKYEIDASILVVTVPLMSLVSAISVFGVIGHLSYVRDVLPENALNGIKGPLSPFVAYSEALSQMWGDPMPWSIIVFSTLFLLSTAAILPATECLISSVSDSLSSCRAIGLRIVSVLLILLFMLTVYFGVPCVVEDSALQFFEFFDTLTMPVCCILIALPELLMITHAFGVTLLRTNIKAMTNNNCLKGLIWPILWGGVTPVILAICLIYIILGAVQNGLSSLAPTLPDGATRMDSLSGWTPIASFVFIGIIFFIIIFTIIFKIARARGGCLEKLRESSTPAALGRSSVHTNGSGRGGRSNGDLYMADYIGHQDTNEILVDDDIVTTV